jgi:hypothetical protein
MRWDEPTHIASGSKADCFGFVDVPCATPGLRGLHLNPLLYRDATPGWYSDKFSMWYFRLFASMMPGRDSRLFG